MNKNMKRIIALVLVFGTISAVAPATNLNLLTTKAYATDENSDTTLERLELKTSNGSNIRLYKGNYNDEKVDSDDVEDNGEYYAKTSSSTISIDTHGPSSKYVKVFKGTSSSSKGKSITSDINLSSGTNILTVRVYNNKPDSDVRYNDGDVASEYTIRVKYTGRDSDSNSDNEYDASDYDNIYLKKLSVDGDSISLSDSKVLYTYNVASNINKVSIKATPDYDYYTVTIDGHEVDEDSDKYKRDVYLDTGVNEIKIKLEDEDNNDEREYTLKITKASTATTGTSTTGTSATGTTPDTATTNLQVDQWVLTNAGWQYHDSVGNLIRNSWFYDKNIGKTYYLLSDGSMATGWLINNGKWYYLGTNGAMQTGWIIDRGKYYYLYADGSMACNTKIGLYKLGNDGAWIR